MKKADMDKAIGHVVRVESRGQWASPKRLAHRDPENHLTETPEGWGVLTGRTERTQVLYHDSEGYRQRNARTFYEVAPIAGLEYHNSVGKRWGRSDDELDTIWVESRYVATMATDAGGARMTADEFVAESAALAREKVRKDAERNERKEEAVLLEESILDAIGASEEDCRRDSAGRWTDSVYLKLSLEEARKLVDLVAGELS